MMKKMALLAAVLVAASGCKALGFTDDSGEDFSANNSRAGDTLMVEGQTLAINGFDASMGGDGAAASATVTLTNQGDPLELVFLDVEFGYPAPEGSFAPYDPHFESIDLEVLAGGESKTVDVVSGARTDQAALFVRVLQPAEGSVRATTAREHSAVALRPGTTFLSGALEVVDVQGDLTAEKPTLAFTLEHVNRNAPDAPIENLKYTVQFFKDGQPIKLSRRLAAFRRVKESVGKWGDRITLTVDNLDRVGESLAGAAYALRIIQE